MPLNPGGTFERYTIEGLVGRGGMGEVYRATDTRLGRPVALKVLRSDEDGARAIAAAGGVARLLREARAAAAFNHPHSVAIYELGEAEGIPYIAMEYVKGHSLRRYCADGKTPLATKVGWLADAARALHAAHKAGLVHRDIKPGNIMVSEDGVVKVLDFGLAKPTTDKIDPSGFQTQLGQILGTPRYMAPEQLDGEPADAKADQFAFGLVAYELLAGTYAGGPLAAMPPPLDQVVPGATAELAAIVRRMLARRAPERYPTMDDVAVALRAASAGVTGAGAPAKRPSDAPTREVKAAPVPRAAHRTEPIPVTPSMSPPSKEGWNRTMPMAQVQTPSGVSLQPPPSLGYQTPPSMPAAVSGAFSGPVPSPRQPYPSQPIVTPTSGPVNRPFPIALVAIVFGIAALVGIGVVLFLLRR